MYGSSWRRVGEDYKQAREKSCLEFDGHPEKCNRNIDYLIDWDGGK